MSSSNLSPITNQLNGPFLPLPEAEPDEVCYFPGTARGNLSTATFEPNYTLRCVLSKDEPRAFISHSMNTASLLEEDEPLLGVFFGAGMDPLFGPSNLAGGSYLKRAPSIPTQGY